MQLTPHQDVALQKVARWLKDRDRPFFYLAGYAGTGKTTITKKLVENLDGRAVFGAYTGKAATVMERNGCFGATTIHRLIYKPKGKSREELLRLERLLADRGPDHPDAESIRRAIEIERQNVSKPNFTLNEASDVRNAALIVVDEVSMVGGRMAQDLLSFGVPLLVIGDPEQLPPVKDTGYFTTREPDAMLTEIHRQAKDNPIIQLATAVRNGEALSLGDYGDSRVLRMGDERVSEDVRKTDQLLVGMRKTRSAYNARMREVLGRKGLLERGDKLVCLRNDHELGMMNGSLWCVKDVGDTDTTEGQVYLTLMPADNADDEAQCWAWIEPFSTGDSIFGAGTDGVQSFTYGYALTVHKSQGSQWDDVVLFDESGVFKANSQRWLYTAITRAAKRVTVVR